MSKLDKQHRLTIPFELRQELGWSFPQKVAICYDFSSPQTIAIHRKENCNDKCILFFRELDSKGRLFFPKEALDLLNASLTDSLVVYLKGGQLFVAKL